MIIIAVTQSIFKLEPPDFAWKQIQIISADDDDDDHDHDHGDDHDHDEHGDDDDNGNGNVKTKVAVTHTIFKLGTPYLHDNRSIQYLQVIPMMIILMMMMMMMTSMMMIMMMVKNQNGHNSVSFQIRTSSFCIVTDLDRNY